MYTLKHRDHFMTITDKLKAIFEPIVISKQLDFQQTEIIIINDKDEITFSTSCDTPLVYKTLADHFNTISGETFDFFYEPLRTKNKQLNAIFETRRFETTSFDTKLFEVNGSEIYFFNDHEYHGNTNKILENIRSTGRIIFRTTFFEAAARKDDKKIRAQGLQAIDDSIKAICDHYEIKESLYDFLINRKKQKRPEAFKDRGWMLNKYDPIDALNVLLEHVETISEYAKTVKGTK